MAILAKHTVGVMGSGSDEYPALASELGQLLARLDVNLLTGAGTGVMSSVTRAFVEANPKAGIAIGIVPCEDEDNRAERKKGYPNAFIQLAIITHLPYSGRKGEHDLSRNHINVLTSVAIVALPGKSGTESEVELAIKYGKPIVAFCEDLSQVERFNRHVPRVTTIGDVEKFLRTVLA